MPPKRQRSTFKPAKHIGELEQDGERIVVSVAPSVKFSSNSNENFYGELAKYVNRNIQEMKEQEGINFKRCSTILNEMRGSPVQDDLTLEEHIQRFRCDKPFNHILKALKLDTEALTHGLPKKKLSKAFMVTAEHHPAVLMLLRVVLAGRETLRYVECVEAINRSMLERKVSITDIYATARAALGRDPVSPQRDDKMVSLYVAKAIQHASSSLCSSGVLLQGDMLSSRFLSAIASAYPRLLRSENIKSYCTHPERSTFQWIIEDGVAAIPPLQLASYIESKPYGAVYFGRASQLLSGIYGRGYRRANLIADFEYLLTCLSVKEKVHAIFKPHMSLREIRSVLSRNPSAAVDLVKEIGGEYTLDSLAHIVYNRHHYANSFSPNVPRDYLLSTDGYIRCVDDDEDLALQCDDLVIDNRLQVEPQSEHAMRSTEDLLGKGNDIMKIQEDCWTKATIPTRDYERSVEAGVRLTGRDLRGQLISMTAFDNELLVERSAPTRCVAIVIDEVMKTIKIVRATNCKVVLSHDNQELGYQSMYDMYWKEMRGRLSEKLAFEKLSRYGTMARNKCFMNSDMVSKSHKLLDKLVETQSFTTPRGLSMRIVPDVSNAIPAVTPEGSAADISDEIREQFQYLYEQLHHEEQTDAMGSFGGILRERILQTPKDEILATALAAARICPSSINVVEAGRVIDAIVAPVCLKNIVATVQASRPVYEKLRVRINDAAMYENEYQKAYASRATLD